MILVIKIAAAVLLAFLFVIISVSDSYIDYVSLIGVFCTSFFLWFFVQILFPKTVAFIKKPHCVYLSIFIIYYTFGILPLSTYRGYIDVMFWGGVLISAVLSFLLGVVIAKAFVKRLGASASSTNIGYQVSFEKFFLLLSLGCFLYINLKHGVVFLNPEERFNISAKISYLVEFIIPVVICIVGSSSYTSKQKVYVFLFSILVLLSLGYRNQPLLVVLGVCFVYLINLDVSTLLRFRSLAATVIASLYFFLGLAFLIRTNNSIGRTLDWAASIKEFEIQVPLLALGLMPLHQAAREGLGVAQIALERIDGVLESVSRAGFFWLDFSTMLPSFSLTSGRVLGEVVNLNETSSLTPSALGGLMISYGHIGVVLFFLLQGFLLSFLYAKFKYTRKEKYIPVLVVFLIYMLEFINRGIFKPMYVFAVIIALLVSGFWRVNEKEMR